MSDFHKKSGGMGTFAFQLGDFTINNIPILKSCDLSHQ
jgi:hypothetical protein